MGNSKCKQSHSSVFQNEEEEETWFEWMESTNERNQTSVTPRTHPLPVQPLAFQADLLERSKSMRSKPALYFFTDGNVLRGLHKAGSENDRISEESALRIENNNSLRKNEEAVMVEDEAIYSPVSFAFLKKIFFLLSNIIETNNEQAFTCFGAH